MPPRNEHEYESRRQQIIEGALQVFSRKGFEKTTNKEIAEAAGIASPGLIYHYFQDKADLFRQVLEEGAPVFQLLNHSDALMELPPREVLTRLAAGMLDTLTHPRYHLLFKLMLGEALRRPTVAGIFNAIGPARGFAFLSAYLQHQMNLGRLQQTDPGAAARCFLGPLVAYVLSREVFLQPDTPTLQPETMVTVVVDTFLWGLEVGAHDTRLDSREARDSATGARA
jgi:TetR/AcrR family transcriptional regulator, mexJK operon transcriptional repressor